MAIMSMVCFVGMVHHGAGRHRADVKEEWKEGLDFWTYILGLFLVTGIGLVKISIGFLLKRFAQRPGQHRFIWGMVLFLAVFMAYSVVAFSVTCVPLRANWVPGLRAAPTTKCQSKEVLSIIGTVNGGEYCLCPYAFIRIHRHRLDIDTEDLSNQCFDRCHLLPPTCPCRLGFEDQPPD